MNAGVLFAVASMLAWSAGAASVPDQGAAESCSVALMVLGTAQDAGRPQFARPDDPAWTDTTLRRLPAALALVDAREATVSRWLFEATPDIKEQLWRLDQAFPASSYVGLDGVFITHAHMGHYTGLIHFGREAAGTDKLPVYVMPLMKAFLESNGPWDQLVRLENIEIRELGDGKSTELGDSLSVVPFLVPHRREYSETVGFIIDGPQRGALFLPDIDSWSELDESGTTIEELIKKVDIAFLDATFYGDEMPNISEFPHPKVLGSMSRFDALPDVEKAKVRFIHLNHSNPVALPDSSERRLVIERGFSIAEENEIHCLQ